MAAVLGVSAYYHDAAAALVIDGLLVCAIQEERLSRVKHDPSLPTRAIDQCLRQAGIRSDDLDSVVYYENPFAKLERVVSESLRHFPKAARQFPRALSSQLGSKLWVLDHLAKVTGIARKRVTHVDHHESHAASAYFASPFDEAAVLTIDGVGERVTTGIWHGVGDSVTCKLTQELPDSLGLVYAGFTAWLGFQVNADEYKVMGLAAYGAPKYRELIERVLKLHSDGSYGVDSSYFDCFVDPDRAYGPSLVTLLGMPRAPDRPWDFTHEDDQRYADVAASLQVVIEEAVLGLAARAQRETGSRNLCLAGGVALNARVNARLSSESGFARVFAQPAAGDAGGALGAAWLGSLAHGDRVQHGLPGPDLGSDCETARCHDVARAAGLVVSREDQPAARVARAIERGDVIGVMAGRCEWGPRALGHRSILAAPGPADMRERINARVKGRELFRPLAPSVLAEQFDALFEEPADDLSPWMTGLRTLRAPLRERLGAVVHVDGTSRPQAVGERPSVLRDVLLALQAQTGLGVALNTSLNLAGEPIVTSGIDGIDLLLRCDLDALLVDDLWIDKP